MTVVICERVTVTISKPEAGAIQLEIPAYTRSPVDFGIHIARIMEDYLQASEEEGVQPSTADFALFLITKAYREPRLIAERDE